MRFINMSLLLGCCFAVLGLSAQPVPNARLELLSLHPEPVVGKNHPNARDNRFGFEGGTAVKVGKDYYLFTTECFDEPKTAATRLALWKSRDGNRFKRMYELVRTNFNWNDSSEHRMSPWSPMLVFDPQADRWSVFHVAYSRKPLANVYNMHGKIRRYDSTKPGRKGIAGPYREGGLLALNDAPEPWEGKGVGLLSFFPFQVGSDWYGFYGSNTVTVDQGVVGAPAQTVFRAGLAKAQNGLTGEWKRQPQLNPVLFDPLFIENTIVTKIREGLYIAVYDGANKHEISYACSADGLHWGKEQLLVLPNAPAWLHDIRTPLGLIDEGGGEYTIYFTAFDGQNPDNIPPLWHRGFGNIGKVRVKVVE